MTVIELINLLKEFPPDVPVLIDQNYEGRDSADQITICKLKKVYPNKNPKDEYRSYDPYSGDYLYHDEEYEHLKPLTFEAVIIAGWEDDIWPSIRPSHHLSDYKAIADTILIRMLTTSPRALPAPT